jgi:hypothetical protein
MILLRPNTIGAYFGGYIMGTVRKTVTLTDKQDAWIKAQIDAGHYTNDSEYDTDVLSAGFARLLSAGHLQR